jgi:hypothetical protein
MAMEGSFGKRKMSDATDDAVIADRFNLVCAASGELCCALLLSALHAEFVEEERFSIEA